MRFGMRILVYPAIAIAAACGGGGGDSSSNPGGVTNPNPTPTVPVLTSAVTVSDNQFTPADIQVAPGTTVTWTWASGASTHNVSFTDGVSSGDRGGANASFSRTFATAGTFTYVCTLHGGMSGSVLVK